MDVDSIALGRDFRSALQKTLTSCDLDRRIVSADLRAGLAESACSNASGQLAGKPAMAVAVDLEAEGDQVATRRWIRPNRRP
jgi:hypothetical protein